MVKWLISVTVVLTLATGGVYLYRHHTGPERLDSPENLAARALTAATVAERERAALDLARSGPAALPHLRRVLAESDTPPVRAAVIEGLGAQRDWPSMPLLLAAMDDADRQVRGRAGVAASRILGLDFFFDTDASPDERAAVIAEMKACYASMQKAPPPDYRKE